MLYGALIPISAFNDPEKLVERKPMLYNKERAYEEMHEVLMSYVEEYWPDVYAQIPKGVFLQYFNVPFAQI